jgi:hypothetical protein
VFIAILVHASIDDFGGLLGIPFSPSDMANIILVSFGPLAVLIVALTRGRLGYQNYRQEEEPNAAAAQT